VLDLALKVRFVFHGIDGFGLNDENKVVVKRNGREELAPPGHRRWC
jgi:hypothetical protein